MTTGAVGLRIPRICSPGREHHLTVDGAASAVAGPTLQAGRQAAARRTRRVEWEGSALRRRTRTEPEALEKHKALV